MIITDDECLRLAVNNSARFNEPVFEKPEGALHDWEILNRLGDAISKRKDIKNSMLPPPEMLMDMALQNGPYSKKAGHAAELSLAV